MSAEIPIASPPLVVIAVTALSIYLCARATTATQAPSAASILAASRSMPLLPPTTRAVRHGRPRGDRANRDRSSREHSCARRRPPALMLPPLGRASVRSAGKSVPVGRCGATARALQRGSTGRSGRGCRGGLRAEGGSDLGGVAGDRLPDQARGEPAPVDLSEDAVQAESLGGVKQLVGDLAD